MLYHDKIKKLTYFVKPLYFLIKQFFGGTCIIYTVMVSSSLIFLWFT